MDKSSTLSAYEFYAKYHVKEKQLNIFEEVDDEKDDNSGKKKKSARPTVPLNQRIKEPPSSHEELTKLLRENLRLKDLKLVSLDEQKQLADVLTLAIISIWPEHRKQRPHPFLSAVGNKELQRRIAVYVVQTAEQLFYEYVSKAAELNEKAVFSAEANISRLKTQILHDSSSRLDVVNVGRKLVAVMRHVPDEKWFEQYPSKDAVLYPDFAPLDSKTKFQIQRAHQQFTRKQINEIEQHMSNIKPTLPTQSTNVITQRIIDTMNNNAEEYMDAEYQSSISLGESADRESFSDASVVISETGLQGEYFIQRSSSMPSLCTGAQSEEEFGGLTAVRECERKQSVDQLLDGLQGGKQNVDKEFNISEDPPFETKEEFHVEPMEDDEFSPLLQVQGTREKKKPNIVPPVLPSGDDEDLSADLTEEDLFMHLTDEDEFMREEKERFAAYTLLPQPSFVNAKVPGKGIVRISDVSVSTRINESSLVLHKYPTMYNEFLGEIDDATVKSLDEHLFAGKQAQEVYDEITKTMNKDFLHFDKDDFVEQCAPPIDDTHSLFMSAMLQGRHKSHLISEELRSETNPPWSEFQSNQQWRNEPRFGGLGREEILKMKVKENNRNTYDVRKSVLNPDGGGGSTAHITKSYSAWLSWYKTHLDTDDYKKFLYHKENDYLCQLFHLYDSEDSDEDEEENLHVKTMEMKILEEQYQRKVEIRAQKKHFEKGYWNTQCVVLGGLGKDPDINEMEEEEICCESEDDEEASSYVYLQERLEQVWKLLKAPEQLRVDMAMRYSGFGGAEKLTKAIDYWEDVTDLIIERENSMARLEDFERSASDPNRFFQKGPSGSSVARINEEKTREVLVKTIKSLDEKILPQITFIKKQFGDVVTYQGRVYCEKVKNDCVEMLYWLQQERRQQALEIRNTDNAQSNTPIKCLDITPIMAT